MKKVLFCIVCLSMVLFCFGQPVRVKLVAEKEAIVLFDDERYDLKRGETRQIVLEGEPMFSGYLHATEGCFLFLEGGDSLEVILRENGRVDLKDDGTLCARRNNWLRRVETLKEKLYQIRVVPQFFPEKERNLNLGQVCDTLNLWLEQYLQENPADRKNFEKVMRTEFKYFRLSEEGDFRRSKATFFEFPESVLSRFTEITADAGDDRVVYSPSYWRLVRIYVDYLRIEDPRGLQGAASDIYANEIKLARYFPKGAVRDRVAFHNLDEIVYWVRPDTRRDFDKCVKELAPRYAKLMQIQLDRQDSTRRGKKLMLDDYYPSLSGENVDGKEIRLSSFKGAWILLDVWATWCGPCCNEIPFLSQLEERLGDRNIEFISLSVDKVTDREKWKKMIREKEMKGTQLRWTGDKKTIYDLLCIHGIPHFAIIDPTGKVVWNGLPSISYGQIYRILNEISRK